MISDVDIKDYKADNYLQPFVGERPRPFSMVMDGKNEFRTGIKHDQEKPPIDLIDPVFLEGVAKVLDFGAKKYARHNWRNGIAYSRLIAAAYRHLGAINKGEDFDEETGLSHAYHLGCCVMFLSHHLDNPRLKAFDDRYKE